MSTLYILTTPTVAELPYLQEILEDAFSIELISSWDDLKERLSSQKEGVVVFSGNDDLQNTVMGKIKSILPSATGIAICTRDSIGKAEPPSEDCDFLVLPATHQEIKSRVRMAIRLSEMKATLETTVQLDEVTQLYNRCYFLNRLNEEISMAKRHLSPLTCVVIGINYFQVYLDSYGYGFINQFLNHVTLIIQKQVRHEDIVARVSDDELALLLPRSSEKGAKILTQRIVEVLQASPYLHDCQEEEVSVHAGIAGFPLEDETRLDADSLLRYARHALHQARCAKKERVQLFSEIRPSLY